MSLFSFSVMVLNSAAFVYLAGCILAFIAVARSGSKAESRIARVCTWFVLAGWLMHSSGLGTRWIIGGISRPPWTNLYESLVFFAWGVATLLVYAQRKWKLPLLAAVGLPLIFILMGMSVMTPNKLVEPLIPALQSYWLKIHVVFGMTSYAGFTTAGCLAFLHLLKNKVPLSRIGAGLCVVACLNLGIAGGGAFFNHGRLEMARTTTRQLPDGTEVKVKDSYQEYEGGPMLTHSERVPGGGAVLGLAFAAFALALASFVGQGRRRKTAPEKVPALGRLAFCGGLAAMLALFVVIAEAVRNSATLTLSSNPYLVILLFATFLFGLFFMLIVHRYEPFMKTLPSAHRLDELSYKTVLFAFPFQTLLLITGAIWAYYAWGRSWGWDPKETWAFITWLAFLIYLHGKLLMNWKPNFLSVVAICGFLILVFAFLGVNLVLSGLHSYGSA